VREERNGEGDEEGENYDIMTHAVFLFLLMYVGISTAFLLRGPGCNIELFADIQDSFAKIQGAIAGVAMIVKTCYSMAL